MAEIRKHDSILRSQIAQAIQAALTENVRPTTPGAPPIGAEEGLPSVTMLFDYDFYLTGVSPDSDEDPTA